MKVNKAPCGVAHTVSIAKGNITSTDGGDSVKGGILKGTKYAWLCQGPFLKIIDVSNGEKIAGWRFGAASSEFVTEVSCAVELPYNDDACNLKQIVLGLECEVVGGMICIFDMQGSRLLRAIRIPGKPLSLSIVDSGSSGCEGCYPLPGLLSSMSGIIAVGLQGGSVFLIDLCRLTCEELLNTWFNDDRDEVHDEVNPCQLVPINKDDDDSDKLEKKCAAAAVSGDHLCLLLNEAAFAQDNFLLLEPGGNMCACFKTRNIGVTSLLYVPRIASLVVGYSFGCFQLWNLMHLTLNYTSRLMKDPLPVMHLGFQEPSDDPCNFCYLWAVHSSSEEFPSSGSPVGIMYALSYDSKEWVDGYGHLYQDYQSCHFRFEYNLEVDVSEEVDSVSCVSFNTLNNIATQRNMPEDGYDEVASENDLSLCIFAWEAYDSENKPISTYLSLFDLNQWYKDQMPVRVTDAEDENLGYLVTFPLNCIRQRGEETSQIETPLLDIRVDPQSLSQFKSFQPQEEHFHPAALSFVSHCLLEDKLVSLSHPGLQRYLLLYMEKEGPICLLRPVNLFKHCVMVGLKPVLMDINGSSDVSAVGQREFLLSIALENQMLGFLHKCASDWANGSVSGVDCSLPMLLSWGFQRAMVLKETADGLCVHLFDHTGIHLDKNECRLLDNCASQLRQLSTLFEGILSDCRLLSLLNLEDFKEKTCELNMSALYFEVLLWFLNVGLLPEFPEDDFDNAPSDFGNSPVDKIPYPATVLTKFYADRRLEFKNLNSKNGTKASLYIDQLLQNESNGSGLANLWISDGGSGMYPPPSIQSLLAMYLQDGIDVQTKNSIVIYVFLDLATLLDPERYSRTIEYFVKFPCAFCMTPSIIKVTQAFWLLDQKHFEDALDMVLDPLVSPKDLQPWQHRFIVHALLSQGQHSKALEYFTVRQLPIQGIEDIQLKITLLVMNKQVTQAYNFLQQYRSEENNKELLYHFYQECGKARQLGTVLKLVLSPAEEELLMNYLQSCNLSQSEDMQVVYFLMRSRVIEAVAVNERINFSGNRKVGVRRTRNNPTVRDVLVEGYAKTLPSVTRQLANYCSQQKQLLSNWRQVQRPTPMSVDVHYGTKQPVSYKSSLIHATLEKARETWMMPVHSSFASEARSKEMMDVSAMQNLPFLCTSHDSMRHDRETTPVVFPSVTSSVKRRLDDDGALFSVPRKRSRYETSPPVESFLLLSNKKSAHDLPVNNSSVLLKSPLVKRVTPLKQFNGHSAQDKNGSKLFAESFTPQSILKVRNLVRSSISPEHSVRLAEDLLPREQRAKNSEERSCARQIRFSLPVPNEVEEQPLSSSTPAKEVKIMTSKRIVDASARLPLRSSLSLLQKSITITERASSVEKKSYSQNSPVKENISRSLFVFGSANVNTPTSAESDAESAHNESDVQQLNESLGDESFYSATNSSGSGTSKASSKMDTDGENSPSYNSGKYIDNIKEIKPRRHLSRLKAGTQSNMTVNNVCRQREEAISDREDDVENHSDESDIINEKSVVAESREKQREFSSEEEEEEEDDVDDQERDVSEDDSNINGSSTKKSILGDTCLVDSISTNEEILSGSDTGEECDDSLRNKSQDANAEISQRSEDCSIIKIQQIKARRPLSRVCRSENLDNSSFSVSEMEESSVSGFGRYVKESVLLEDTVVENTEETKERKENVKDQGNIIDISDDEEVSDVNDKMTNDSDEYVEIIGEHKANVPASESEEPVSVLISTEIRSSVMWKESTAQEESVCISDVSGSIVQKSYFQDSCNIFLDEEFVSQNADTPEGNTRQEEFIEKDHIDLVSDCGKTYVSLTTVTTEQPSYEHGLPLNHSDVNQGISVLHSYDSAPEGQGNMLVSLTAENAMYTGAVTVLDSNIHESCVENICTVDDGDILDIQRVCKSSQNTETSSNAHQIKQNSSSTTGTIELDSVESEAKSTGRSLMPQQDNVQQVALDYQKECSPKVSSDEKEVCEDSLHSTTNVKDIHSEKNIIFHSDSECDKITPNEQPYSSTYEKEHSMEVSKTEGGDECEKQISNKEDNTNPDDLCWSSNSNENELVLNVLDSKSNTECKISKEGIEIQSQSTEEYDDKAIESMESKIILETPLENASDEIIISVQNRHETEPAMSWEHVTEYRRNTSTDEKFEEQARCNINHSVCNEVVTTTNTLQEEMQTEQNFSQPLVDANLNRDSKKLQCMETEQPQSHDGSSENRGHTTNVVAETEHQSSSKAKSTAPASSMTIEAPQIQNVTVSEYQEAEKNDSGVFRGHYSLKVQQRSRPSSVQSEPPQITDVLVSENQGPDENVETSQEHTGQRSRPRRRRSSLQIETLGMTDKSAFECKNEAAAVEIISTPRTRQRSRPSSVQSESPEMADVSETEAKTVDASQEHSRSTVLPRRQRSSFQIEPQQMNDEFVGGSKNETATGEEISTQQTRQRRQSVSNVQSEPTQMTNEAEVEHEAKDQSKDTPQKHSGGIIRHRRRSFLKTEPLQRDGECVVESKDGTKKVDEISTPRTRQRRRPSSIQSEPPHMTDVLDMECHDKSENVDASQEYSGHISRTRRRRSSLQIEPYQMDGKSESENKDVVVAVEDIFTPKMRLRSRASSVQSEPPQIADVSMEGNEEVNVNQGVTEQADMMIKQKGQRSSLQSECIQTTDVAVTQNLRITGESSTPRTRQRSRPNSIQGEPSEVEECLKKEGQTQEHEKTLHKNSRNSHDSSLSANDYVPKNVHKGSLALSYADEPQPSTSSAVEEMNCRMNLRSRRAYSVDRELPDTKDKKKSSNSEIFSDSDVCSVQSEPPQLSDVSRMKQFRRVKSRRGSLKKKKSKSSSYVLKMAAPKLPCVKEEPENESSVGDGEITRHPAKSESEVSPAFTSSRNLRRRKPSESAESQTSSVGEGRVLRNQRSDDNADSPVSISSRSTVIIESSKRKRSSSPSSPEKQEVKKFQKHEDGTAAKNDHETSKEKSEEGRTHSEDTLEQYATARRLTRYQKTLMERSMDTTKGVHHEFHRRHLQSDRSGEDSDGESVASGYTSGSSHIRSSARLQGKRQMMKDRSPSQSSWTSHSPQKQLSRHHSPVPISPEKRSERSPVSVRSGRSTSYASSISSSQWPSPNSVDSQSPQKPRRKSFQDAQKALFHPSVKKHTSSKTSVTTTDTSEAESVGESDEKHLKKYVESESGRSQSSAVSSSVSRSTRSSAKNVDATESPRSRKTLEKSASPDHLQPHRELRQRKETTSTISSSSEDSPSKGTKSQEKPTMSEESAHSPNRDSQGAIVKPEINRPFTALKKRKFLKIQSKRKTMS